MYHTPLININNTLTLYRSDISLPPKEWEKDFKCYEYDGIGHKNKAGLFFLTDSIDIARSLGKNNKNRKEDRYYLTECFTTQDVYILDFGYCINLMQMIRVLSDIQLDVFSDDFKTYEEAPTEEHVKTFKKFREVYTSFLQMKPATKSFTQLSGAGYDDDPIGTFGQRLTDFENGINFLKVVGNWQGSIDGYRWREFNDQRGFTYCLLNTSKISAPLCTAISVT